MLAQGDFGLKLKKSFGSRISVLFCEPEFPMGHPQKQIGPQKVCLLEADGQAAPRSSPLGVGYASKPKAFPKEKVGKPGGLRSGCPGLRVAAKG